MCVRDFICFFFVMCFSLRLVNTYGNFGSITKTRGEVVLKGTAHQDPYAADSPWKEYGELCTVTAHPYPTHASLPHIIWTQHNTTSARGFRFTSNCCTAHAAATCFSLFFLFLFGGGGWGGWLFACVHFFVCFLSFGGWCVRVRLSVSISRAIEQLAAREHLRRVRQRDKD